MLTTPCRAGTLRRLSTASHETTISVVIPTRNAMGNLARHVEAMTPWLDLVLEIVVVDSHSTDGTPEYLAQAIAHPRLRILAHPPGLYASWNFGIQQVSGDYVYISTAGDTVTRAGLQGLRISAESLGCDVMISKPVFVDPAGRPLPDRAWPIDGAMAMLGIRRARRLEPAEALLLMAAAPDAAFTGSCASCLYRTRALKARPFRIDVGTAADGIWCLEHALDIAWGIVPDRFSTFMVHETHAAPPDRRGPPPECRPDRLLRAALASRSTAPLAADANDLVPDGARVLESLGRYLEAKEGFDRARRRAWPWVLNPTAWKARQDREHTWQELQNRVRAALARCHPV